MTKDTATPTGPGKAATAAAKQTEKEEKAARLAQSLRDNLRRRKSQANARKSDED